MEHLVRTLEDTHDEIQRVRGEVVEALKSFYGSSSALSADEALRHVLVDLVTQLQLDAQPNASSAVQQRVVHSFAQRERLKRQMEQSRRMLQLVEKVTQLDNHLFEVDNRLDNGDIVSAAGALKSAQGLLEQLRGTEPSETEGGDEVVQFLSLQLLKKKNRLLHQLKQTHSSLMTLLKKKNRLLHQLKQTHSSLMTVKGGAIRIKKPRTPAATSPGSAAGSRIVRALWEASAILGLQQSKLQEYVKLLSQHALRPLFANDTATLKITQEADGVSIVVSAEATTPRQESEINLIEKRLADVVGLSPGNLESHLLALLQTKIPKDTTAVSVYRDTVAALVQDLDRKLAVIGIVNAGSSQLRHFSSQINQLYAKKRRQQILVSARETMNRDYCNAIRVTGATERCNIDAAAGSGKKDGAKGKTSTTSSSSASSTGDPDDVESGCFVMPDYVVSHCAHDIVELAHQTMIEACVAETTCASALFQTSRDVFFLFRAVVPTLYSSEIANDARTCMLFHNDCMYIAYHMLTIGHLYKTRLPSKLGSMVTMVDMVPTFRESAESTLSAFGRSLLDEILGGVQAFKCEALFASAAQADKHVPSLGKLRRFHAFLSCSETAIAKTKSQNMA
ncbi:hypothetical protein ATCC90586_007702 [Pythium insidiosum]|nr:hypothetical protein ATCC90586_007702 [Pythium insidiosum]